MTKDTVKFCRIEAFIDNKILNCYLPKPTAKKQINTRVLDSIINISEKPKLLEDLFNDSDITQICVSEFIDPWYLTKYRRTRDILKGIWYKKPEYLFWNLNFRPYGTPEEVKKIETIWESPEDCRKILGRYNL